MTQSDGGGAAFHAWFGRRTPFSIELTGDPTFARRLVLPPGARGRWIVLTYRAAPGARPERPMIRLLRAGGERQDFVLPGVVFDTAHWLGRLPADLDEIRFAADPGIAIERIGVRHRAGVLAQCALTRPLRVVPALYALLRRDERRLRDILRGACAVAPMRDYAAWKAARLGEPARSDARTELAIRLILPAGKADAAAVAATIDSVIAQTHRAWHLCLISQDGSPLPPTSDARIAAPAWNAGASAADLLGGDDALAFLEPGLRLTPDALTCLALRLAGTDAPDLVYADDEVDGAAPRPRFKPDWSPDFALATGYPGAPMAISRALAERLGSLAVGSTDGVALSLAAISAATSAAHIPRILARVPPRADTAGQREQALARHLYRIGSPARAEARSGVLDLSWPLPEPAPLVSILIPSRDRLDLIARVTEGVLHATDYPALELVVIDNGSTDPGVLALYRTLRADPRVRIESDARPFNFSAMINAGARVATGTVLVLLNNDIAILNAHWLRELVAQAVRPEVGAVGAKLLYDDGRLQHAGVVVGLGGRAGHVLRRRPGDSPGHLGGLRVAHEVSAVTAACLAVERAKFEAVAGLDETTFPIDFNDVDLCLRLGAAGWKTIWTPRAVLAHRESVSRGPAVGAARRRFETEAEAFAERWRAVIRHDPYYHPALSLTTFGEDLE